MFFLSQKFAPKKLFNDSTACMYRNDIHNIMGLRIYSATCMYRNDLHNIMGLRIYSATCMYRNDLHNITGLCFPVYGPFVR
jgi:hypothetical protein